MSQAPAPMTPHEPLSRPVDGVHNEPPLLPPRSSFITFTGWSLIIVGVIGILCAACFGLAWLLLLSADQREVFTTLPLFALMPPSVQLLMRHIGWLSLFLLLSSAAAIPLGVAMKRRRPWARVASVWTCVVLALLHFVAVPWQWLEVDAWFTALRAELPWFAREGLDGMYWSTQLSGAAFAVAFGLAFAWTAWKLARPKVIAEFVQS